MPSNSLMAQFFEGSNIEELIQHMLMHIKAQVEKLTMSASGFTLIQIMHLKYNFHMLHGLKVSVILFYLNAYP